MRKNGFFGAVALVLVACGGKVEDDSRAPDLTSSEVMTGEQCCAATLVGQTRGDACCAAWQNEGAPAGKLYEVAQ